MKNANHHSPVLVSNRRTSILTETILLLALLFAGCSLFFADDKTVARATPSKPHLSSTLRDVTFHSSSLNRDMHYRVILPRGYDSSEKRYPALFLLHGLYGDFTNWSTRTNLVDDVSDLNLIVAMPDAGNSWYVNSASNPDDKFEDYIVKDFVAEIDEHYRTIPEGYARAIAGLSMGGYAAVKFSLKYPTMFYRVGGISAALDASADLDEKNGDFREGLRKVFGELGSPVRVQNDVFSLLSRASVKELPRYYLDCGSDDMFLAVNRKFASRVQESKILYEFHEMPGNHNWKYWDEAIGRFLLFLSRSSFLVSAKGVRDKCLSTNYCER